MLDQAAGFPGEDPARNPSDGPMVRSSGKLGENRSDRVGASSFRLSTPCPEVQSYTSGLRASRATLATTS